MKKKTLSLAQPNLFDLKCGTNLHYQVYNIYILSEKIQLNFNNNIGKSDHNVPGRWYLKGLKDRVLI